MMISFSVQKRLSLTSLHLFIFTFVSFALGNKKKVVIYIKECFAYVFF